MSKQLSEEPSRRELDAINNVVSALNPLPKDSQERVLLYTLHRLGIMELKSPKVMTAEGKGGVNQESIDAQMPKNAKPKFQKTIAELKKAKQPKYATQMAAIVAYYLLVVVPDEQRKETITVDDLRTYFTKADFAMPARPGDILPHAEDSGYFEHQGDGLYKLTERGYDLVEKQMPLKRQG